jgi:hypothetical protein
MIEDLRFIEREVEGRIFKILQANDGHVWYDVPLYTTQDEVIE